MKTVKTMNAIQQLVELTNNQMKTILPANSSSRVAKTSLISYLDIQLIKYTQAKIKLSIIDDSTNKVFYTSCSTWR